jgi:hypothetical protein
LSFWAACLIGFYGLLRKSTLLPKNACVAPAESLVRGDIVNLQFDSFVLTVRHSKTIQFGQRVLQIPFVSCVNRALCPLTALLVLITRSRPDQAAPLFSYCTSVGLKSLDHAAFVASLSQACQQSD